MRCLEQRKYSAVSRVVRHGELGRSLATAICSTTIAVVLKYACGAARSHRVGKGELTLPGGATIF